MKVTKLIREYVERTVDSCYPKPNSEKLLNEQRSRAKDALTEFNKMVEEYADSILSEIKTKYNIPDDFNFHTKHGINYAEFSSYGTALNRKADADIQERNKLKQQKKDEILLSLELGATKSDLDNMIKQLMNEVEQTREGVN